VPLLFSTVHIFSPAPLSIVPNATALLFFLNIKMDMSKKMSTAFNDAKRKSYGTVMPAF
jgi:hypothetical protein